jgi:hypothetical protein
VTDTLACVTQMAGISARQRHPVKSLAALGLVLAVLGAAGLKAETSVNYPAGVGPTGITFDGANIWVTNSGSGTVTKMLASTGATVGTYPVGANPYGVAFDGVNIWIANSAFASDNVMKLLASTGAIVGTYPVGTNPLGVAFDGANIWVTNASSGTATKLLASTGTTVGTYPVGFGPWAAVFDGTNIWVANANQSTVTKLLAATGATLGTYPVGGNPLAIAFDGTNIWVANIGDNSVTKLRASTGATVGTYPVGINPNPVAGGTVPAGTGIVFDGTNIWVSNVGTNSVTKLLASTGATLGVYPVGTHPIGLAFDGVNIWVANNGSNNVTKIDPAGQTTATLSVTNLAFGSQAVGISSAPQSVIVTNSGTGVINIASIAITGANSADYSQTNNCGSSLAVATSCLISANFTPTVSGARTASINVSDNASNSPQTIGLTGTGQPKSQTITFGPLGNLTFPAPPFTLSATATSGLSVTFSTTTPAVCTVSGATVRIIGVGLCAITASQAGNTTYSAAPPVIQGFTVTGPGPQAPSISPAGIVPLDSTASTIQPSEWVSIYGNNLASGTTTWTGNFPTSLGGTSVKINGKSAYLSLVSPGQINLQSPDDSATGAVPVVVTTANGSATSTVTLGRFGPSYALLDIKHVAGIILRPDGSGSYGGGIYDILGPTGSIIS